MEKQLVDNQTIKQLVRDEIDRAAADDFRFLRSIPSTTVWRIIDYVYTLDAMRRELLFDAFAENALFLLLADHDPNLHASKSGNVEYRRLRDALPLMGDWKYQDVRSLRSMAADQRSTKPIGISAGVPAEVLERAAAIKPTDATAIRKRIKMTFASRYGAKAENVGGGCWNYNATQTAVPFRVRIDYGGRSDQLRYEVQFEDAVTGICSDRLTYEGMMGFGFGNWGNITADNLDKSITLLVDCINHLLRIPIQLKGIAPV